MPVRARLLLRAFAGACVLLALAGCRPTLPVATPSSALPDSAYHLDPTLPRWIDPETGYDTTRQWRLDGKKWPVGLIMSPSQSPQFLVGERDGLYASALATHGIEPTFERIDLPPRTFHALQRSKWPFVYMPLAVFTDYSRGHANQGGAGGLQYVLLAGSTAGGGYSLVARDPSIRTVADLEGKLVAQMTSNPVPAALLAAELENAGLAVGEGSDQVRLSRGVAGTQANLYEAGKVDALITLNVLKPALLKRGSHVVTDFSKAVPIPSYTVLAVERSVLEERPDVAKSFLGAHYLASKTAERQWKRQMRPLMLRSWNSYNESQKGPTAAQRLAADQAAYEEMLGDMWPEDRIDKGFIADCFATVEEEGLWDWPGRVDVARLSDLSLYDSVLHVHGEEPQ